jgi:hypothetical protein
MTVSSTEFLLASYNTGRALGDKSISSDATFEIEGFEHLLQLTKQFPWPEIGPGGEIEIPTPMGATAWQPQQLKVAQQGQLGLMETARGHIQEFMEKVIRTNGGKFQAKVYEGTPDQFTRAYKLVDCFFQPDNPDRDFENRAQITLINGTLFFHFFGEKIPGNIVA